MHKVIAVLMAIVVGLAAHAHECKPPKRLTCQELQTRLDQRCPDYDQPDCDSCCPTECEAQLRECQDASKMWQKISEMNADSAIMCIEKLEKVDKCITCDQCINTFLNNAMLNSHKADAVIEGDWYPDTPATPGKWFVGVGPVYYHNLGAQVGAAYIWPNGVTLMGSVMWVPRKPTPSQHGVAEKWHYEIPYTTDPVDNGHPWGAGAMLGKTW